MFVIVGKGCVLYMNEKRACCLERKTKRFPKIMKLPYASILLPNTSR